MSELKQGWQRVKFGEMAECINDRVHDPSQAGVDRYVGLEHLDSESLRIRRWGSPSDVESTKQRFKPGDIIFGKRRAYQRKLAVADFEGICSAHAMVLRAKPGVVLPEFLPFFMQSELFMERAVAISVGSLSPTINWKTLALQEFLLPPLADQSRLSSLLAACESAAFKWNELSESVKKVLKVALEGLMSPTSTGWKLEPLANLVVEFIDYRGKTPSKSESGTLLITAKSVRDGFLELSKPEWIDDESYDTWMTRGLPQEGDILFTTEAPLGLVARAPAGRFALAQRIICLRAAKHVDSGFLYWALRSPRAQQEIRRRSTGTTVAGIKQAVLRRITVPLPALEEQKRIAAELDCISAAAAVVIRRINLAKKLEARLREQILGKFQ